MRTGLIAEKLGMSRLFDANGKHIPVTILEVKNCKVISQKLHEKHGYMALQLGYGKTNLKKVNKPQKGFFAKIGIEPLQTIKEFRIDSEKNLLEVGTKLGVNHFSVGNYVDVQGTSIGKGFAGVMKRHNFRGLRASHGVSLTHRSHGSTGHRQEPAKVFKGKKMAGHMGNATVTIQNLKVIAIDEQKRIILLQGAVPGHKNSILTIVDAKKKVQTKNSKLSKLEPEAIKRS